MCMGADYPGAAGRPERWRGRMQQLMAEAAAGPGLPSMDRFHPPLPTTRTRPMPKRHASKDNSKRQQPVQQQRAEAARQALAQSKGNRRGEPQQDRSPDKDR